MKKTIIALSIITSLPAFANMNDHVASETNTGHKVEVEHVYSDDFSATGVQGQIGYESVALTLGAKYSDNIETKNVGVKFGGENFFGNISSTWFDEDDIDNAYDFSVGYQWSNEDSLMHVKVSHNRLNQDDVDSVGVNVDYLIQATSLHFGGVKVLSGNVDKGVYMTYGAGVQYLSGEMEMKLKDWNDSVSESETGYYGQVGVGYTVNGFDFSGGVNHNTNYDETSLNVNVGYNF